MCIRDSTAGGEGHISSGPPRPSYSDIHQDPHCRPGSFSDVGGRQVWTNGSGLFGEGSGGHGSFCGSWIWSAGGFLGRRRLTAEARRLSVIHPQTLLSGVPSLPFPHTHPVSYTHLT